MKRCLALAVLSVAVVGCTNLQGLQYQGMDPASIKEAVKDKTSAANCYEFIGAGGKVSVMTVNNDAGVIRSGTATVECAGGKATFSNGAKAP